MKYYIEIYIFQEQELNVYHIWEKLYQRTHKALYSIKREYGKNPIGCSFPNYSQNHIGNKLRLFAEKKEHLDNLKIKDFLFDLQDYVHITSVREVPISVNKYVSYYRAPRIKNKETLIKRRAKRLNKSYKEISSLYSNFKQPDLYKYPYIKINSDSSRKNYNLYIVRKEKSQNIKGHFSTYGLSQEATVPLF